MVHKPTVRNEHIEAYRAGDFKEIPADIMELVKARVAELDSFSKKVVVKPSTPKDKED